MACAESVEPGENRIRSAVSPPNGMPSEEVSTARITDREFEKFRQWLFEQTGISLAHSKKSLVSGRLAKRLKHSGKQSYGEYFEFICSGEGLTERQQALDLLTTNETYFFREERHFQYLRQVVLPQWPRGQSIRVWSAASSSGQEIWSIAMTLAEGLGDGNWSILGSDISQGMLTRCRQAVYPMGQAGRIPPAYLKKYCLKGTGQYEGSFMINKSLRRKASFQTINLNEPLPQLKPFDVVFLRNVMIYFAAPTRREVVSRIARLIKPGGYLMIGHSESLANISNEFDAVAPAIHRRR